MRELLDPGVAVLVGVEARLHQPQRERRQREHLAAPRDRLLLEAVERHDGVDEAHLERLLGVVLAAQQPELLRLLRPTRSRSSDAPKPPSQEPTRGPVCPKRALSAAIVRSQTRCRTWPPPIA